MFLSFLSFTFNYDFGTLDANNNYSCNALRIINIVCVFLRLALFLVNLNPAMRVSGISILAFGVTVIILGFTACCCIGCDGCETCRDSIGKFLINVGLLDGQYHIYL